MKLNDGRKLYVITVEDTVVQLRDYAVFAEDDEKAVDLILAGTFLTEGEPEQIDTIRTQVKAWVEVDGNIGEEEETEEKELVNNEG